ncbi:MAG: type I methionyl aminopeptidase [Roseiflexaceae bacterium]
MAVTCKNQRELAAMRRAGAVVGLAHRMLRTWVEPGITTRELDTMVHQLITKHGGYPSFLGYGGPPPYPAATCISVNEELVHGIPGKRRLQSGDIVSIDIGVQIDGYHADSAWSYAVGAIAEEAAGLLRVTEETLYHALSVVRTGARLSDISWAIQSYAEARGYGVIRNYISHGIGRSLHEDPQILNYGPPGRGLVLQPGMTFAIEPMIVCGDPSTRELRDGWTVVTTDGRLAAHYEHTVAVTDGKPEILTSQETSDEVL